MSPIIASLSTGLPPVKPLLVLHLEDSPADQRLLQRCLQQAGLVCCIEAVDDLNTFTRLVQGQTGQAFDAIVADYYLPGFTALQAWQALQAAQPQLDTQPPFILLSGAIGEAAAVEAIRLGMADYVLKDAFSRLPHVLSRALEVAEARRAKAQALAELQASEQQLAALTEHLHASIEAERAAIAREIHDDIGGALTAVKFDLAWISRNTERSSGVLEHSQAALHMLQHALGASQRIMMNLRPPVLDQGLVAAVQWLAHSFSQRTQVPVQWVCSQPQMQVPHAVEVVAYRTAQEALTNVSKYAQASQVYIELACDKDFLTLEVRDNGCGMDATARQKPRSFGLKGLAERARTVQGWLDVSSQIGRGTSIIVSLPLAASKEGGGDCDPRCPM